MGFRPTQFDESVRQLITLPVRLANVKPVATCHPVYVESVLWEGGDTWLLILNNHSGRPLEKVRVTVPRLASGTSVRSQQRSPVKVSRSADGLKIDLPIRLYDFVFIGKG